MSQAELAAGRFSKEYVSQIERGKTRPSSETLEWLAGRLATDREFLEHGLSRADAERLDAALLDGEQLVEEHRYEEALALVPDRADGSRARRPRPRRSVCSRARRGLEFAPASSTRRCGSSKRRPTASVAAGSTDVDRAEVVFEVGVVRYQQSRIADAIVLFDNALELTERLDVPSDRLRSDIFHWRSRCHRRNRDWVAAEEDITEALQLAEACSDPRRTADALFQASLVAQRQGSWVLARSQAEQARELFASLGDRATVARLLNNLAGLNHLLGNDARAVTLLEEAFEIFVGARPRGRRRLRLLVARRDPSRAEASSREAEAQARKALDLLGGRVDHLQEIGTAQLTLGRALAGQGSLDEAETSIADAEATFERAQSVGHRSSAWVARGDVESSRGHDALAAGLYRRAALALREPDV